MKKKLKVLIKSYFWFLWVKIKIFFSKDSTKNFIKYDKEMERIQHELEKTFNE